jgi:hypothetical protein
MNLEIKLVSRRQTPVEAYTSLTSPPTRHLMVGEWFVPDV